MSLSRNSLGIGDRFAREAEAQLTAILKAREESIEITPVWNKSSREHEIIHSHPSETREKADLAVRNLNWNSAYYVDADHINLFTVDSFVEHCDYFTIDVAHAINQPAPHRVLQEFLKENKRFIGEFYIPGIDEPYEIDSVFLERVANKFLLATIEAGMTYKHIKSRKRNVNFITEISMDEVELCQSPAEIFFILGMLRGIPADTFAPKLMGQFYKGIDYVGDVSQFKKYFNEIMLVLSHARNIFHLSENLKISIHSGSDKFSIYPAIREACLDHDEGIHLKTAGTTWLEEIIGLAIAGGEALETVKSIYKISFQRLEELSIAYKEVINIDPEELPDPGIVESWEGEKFANTLRHIRMHQDYNPHFRQLLHIGYKVAAEMGSRYLVLLEKHRDIISQQVVENLFDRHIIPLFS